MDKDPVTVLNGIVDPLKDKDGDELSFHGMIYNPDDDTPELRAVVIKQLHDISAPMFVAVRLDDIDTLISRLQTMKAVMATKGVVKMRQTVDDYKDKKTPNSDYEDSH